MRKGQGVAGERNPGESSVMAEPRNEAGWADDLRARRVKPEQLRREWAAVVEEGGLAIVEGRQRQLNPGGIPSDVGLTGGTWGGCQKR